MWRWRRRRPASSRKPSPFATRRSCRPRSRTTPDESSKRRSPRHARSTRRIRKTSRRRSGWAAGPRNLSRFTEAIEIYTRAIEIHGDEPRLYRHRGHRYITIRKPDLAIKDLQKAAQLVEGQPDQVEPDGQPNDRNVPTSTLQTNIYYHLGLAHYLKGDFPLARDAYRKCLQLSKNPDMVVATSAWLYMTLERMGPKDEARQALQPITSGLDVIENSAYYRLLLYYKGELQESALTGKGGDAVIYAYGLANRELWSGAQR